MAEIRRALLGMHNEISEILYKIKLKQQGYDVCLAKSVKEMKEAMGISPEGSRQNFYHLYLMDVNLGYPGAYRDDSANEILKLVKADYDSGKVKFLAVSGNPLVVRDANKDGIPCLDKNDDKEISDFIKS